MKASPVALLVGFVSVRDLAAYVGIAATVSMVLACGALVAAAKAWRERAEARTDEATDLRQEMSALKAELADLRVRPDLREVSRAASEEHSAIVAAIDRMGGQLLAALDRNTVALETLAKYVPWEEIVRKKPAQ